MKKINIYASIILIVTEIIAILAKFGNFIFEIDISNIIFSLIYIIPGIYAIIAIINAFKTSKKIALLQIITAIAIILINVILYATLYIDCGIVLFTIVFVAIILKNNHKLERKNNKNLLAFIIFMIILLFEMYLVISPVIINMLNFNNLKNAIEKIEQSDAYRKYCYQDIDGKITIIDEEINKVAEFENYNKIRFLKNIKINEKIVSLGYVNENDKIFIINNKGEKLFEIHRDILSKTLSKVFDEKTREISYVQNFLNKYCIGKKYSGIIEENYLDIESDKYKEKRNALYEYTEDMSSFEDNKDYEYMYFKNDNLSNNILQVEYIPDSETENSIMSDPDTSDDRAFHLSYSSSDDPELRLVNMINLGDFYDVEKNYYLINIERNEKIKLECYNLIYESYFDVEGELIKRILLYDDNSIPYYDSEETGYFELENGNKHVISNEYIIQEVTDEYEIIFDTETRASKVIDKNTGEEKYCYDELRIYNNFYVIYDDLLGEYKVLNKKFETLLSKISNFDVISDTLLYVTVIDEDDVGITKKLYNYKDEKLNLLAENIEIIQEFSTRFEERINLDLYYDSTIYAILEII